MGHYRLPVVLALGVGLAVIARADVVHDPEIEIDAGSFSSAFTNSSTCTPDTAGGGICDFYNPNMTPIMQAEFTVQLMPSLGADQDFGLGSLTLDNPSMTMFKCAAPGIFLNCLISYVPESPALDLMTFFFYGTDSNDPGIPPLPPGCLSMPDSPTCKDAPGHFGINLNDNNSPDPNGSGGWDDIGAGTFKTASITLATPEPSLTLLLGAGCALVFGFARRRRGASR